MDLPVRTRINIMYVSVCTFLVFSINIRASSKLFIRARSFALGSPALIGLNQGYNQSLLGSPAPIGNPRVPR